MLKEKQQDIVIGEKKAQALLPAGVTKISLTNKAKVSRKGKNNMDLHGAKSKNVGERFFIRGILARRHREISSSPTYKKND